MVILPLLLALQTPGDSLTLSAALARARSARAQIEVTAAQVGGARAALRTAGAIPNPAATYSHSESTPRQHFLVDQPLDWVLRRGADRRAARAGVSLAEADSAITVAGLLRDVRVGFYRARAARLSQALVGTQAELADSVARIAAARLRAGDISLLEQEQAVQEATRARRAESVAREEARIAEAGLARAIAWQGPLPPPGGPLDAGLDQLPDTSLDLQTTPALRAATADSAAAAALAVSASRARVPVPSLQAGAEWGDPTQPGALATVGLSLPLPIWNRGGGPLAEARARAAQTAGLARESRLETVRMVEEARIHLEETAGRARLARDSLLPAAAVVRARALRAYQAGETGILPVIDALRSERDVSLFALQDQLAFQEALAGWDALTGRME